MENAPSAAASNIKIALITGAVFAALTAAGVFWVGILFGAGDRGFGYALKEFGPSSISPSIAIGLMVGAPISILVWIGASVLNRDKKADSPP